MKTIDDIVKKLANYNFEDLGDDKLDEIINNNVVEWIWERTTYNKDGIKYTPFIIDAYVFDNVENIEEVKLFINQLKYLVYSYERHVDTVVPIIKNENNSLDFFFLSSSETNKLLLCDDISLLDEVIELPHDIFYDEFKMNFLKNYNNLSELIFDINNKKLSSLIYDKDINSITDIIKYNEYFEEMFKTEFNEDLPKIDIIFDNYLKSEEGFTLKNFYSLSPETKYNIIKKFIEYTDSLKDVYKISEKDLNEISVYVSVFDFEKNYEPKSEISEHNVYDKLDDKYKFELNEDEKTIKVKSINGITYNFNPSDNIKDLFNEYLKNNNNDEFYIEGNGFYFQNNKIIVEIC